MNESVKVQVKPRWSKEELEILHKNAKKTPSEIAPLLPRRDEESIKQKMLREHLIKQEEVYDQRRENPRQIILRFVKYKQPNGTTMKTSRSTLVLVEEGLFNINLWNKLRDWCLNEKGVEFGKATKTVTVNVLVIEP